MSPFLARVGHHSVPRVILSRLDRIVADLSKLTSSVDALATEVSAAVAALHDLSAKAAAGDSVSQSDIDAIASKLATATTELSAAVNTDDPHPAAPPVSPAPPTDPAPPAAA